jgi:hypothetical protein
MTTRRLLLALPVCLFLPTLLLAEESPVKSRIVSVGLFKNGLAVIKRQVTVPGPGTYRFDEVPTPIHGTYWVESDASIETSIKMREVEGPPSQAVGANLQEELAGKRVVIHLRDSKASPIAGTVAKLERARGEDAWARTYQPRGYSAMDSTPHSSSRFLILDLGSRRAYVDQSQIVSLESEDTGNKVKQRRPQLVVVVEKTEKKPVTVSVTYLARGLSWAPSYRVDITDPKQLSLEQAAVIKNELADLDGAEVGLISGFPSIQFANVTSPFSTRTTWTSFFQELSQRGGRQHDITSNVITQQQLLRNFEPVSLDLSATPTGEGVDLHYQSIGSRTLAEGDTLSLTVAHGQANYERIVEWLIPDNRDADGSLTGRRRGDGDSYEDVPWDALRFRNPLSFPMTTAPALVVSGGRFNGQRLSTWTNAGEETIVHVTQALSIRTRNLEQEEMKGDEGRQVVYVGGRRYRKTNVAAELTVSNHRKEDVKMVVRRRFSGELTRAEGLPKTVLREEGVYSVNRRNELIWTFPLKSGEQKKLSYHYSVLVSF